MTSLPPIDRDTALRLLEKQVQLAGSDYVYGTDEDVCQYVNGGQPDCLIARALVDYGVPISVIAAWDDPTKTIGMAYKDHKPGFLTCESVAVFEAAQDVQDCAKSWGAALAKARAVAADLATDS